jgi:hypothetical protein
MNWARDQNGAQQGAERQAQTDQNDPSINPLWSKPKHSHADSDLQDARKRQEYTGPDRDAPVVSREASRVDQMPVRIVHEGLADVSAGVQKRHDTKDQKQSTTIGFVHGVSPFVLA